MRADAGGAEGVIPDIVSALTELAALWASATFHDRFNRAAEVALDSTEGRIVWALKGGVVLRPVDLASALGVGTPAVTKAVARLRARGYVEVGRHPGDGRSVRVSLTSDGSRAAMQFVRAVDEMLRYATQGWSAADIAQFSALLTRFSTSTVAFARHLEVASPDAD